LAGTILNVITVFIGSLTGLALGQRFSDRMQESIVLGLSLVTFVIGIQNALVSGNIIIPVLAVVFGVIIGEWLRLDQLLDQFASWLQQRFASNDGDDVSSDAEPNTMSSRQRFITGFVTASLVFCVGPLTIIGSIQDGMGLAVGFQLLAIKSIMDMFASMAFAASFGVGVLFTTITIFVIQGSLSLIGQLLVQVMSDSNMLLSLQDNPAILEMTAVGGILLLGLALTIAEIKHVRIANFLPALIIAPLIVIIAGSLGIDIYPL